MKCNKHHIAIKYLDIRVGQEYKNRGLCQKCVPSTQRIPGIVTQILECNFELQKHFEVDFFQLFIQQFHMDQSSSIIKEFEIAFVNCNEASHIGEDIKALCLRQECKKPSAACFQCSMEFHKECWDSIKYLKDIPQLVIPFLKVLSKLEYYKKYKNMPIKTQQLVEQLTRVLVPISEYQENQGLKNLNQLGTFLKLNIQASIIEQSERVEFELQSEDIQQKQKLEFDALEKQIIDLCGELRAEEALKLVEQNLQNNQENKVLWNLKGFALNELSRYQEAIDCCDQAIKINPKYAYPWNNKGCVLNELSRYQEAIDCFDQALKIDPEFPVNRIFFDRLKTKFYK